MNKARRKAISDLSTKVFFFSADVEAGDTEQSEWPTIKG